jgi:hypothetical protein
VHLNDEHNAKAAKRKTREDLWASVHLQTFFAGPKGAIRYFASAQQEERMEERVEEEGEEERRLPSQKT